MNDDIIELGKKEIDPQKEAEYRELIERARSGVNRLKRTTPLGHVERRPMPLLQNLSEKESVSPMTPEGGIQPRPPGSPSIRPETLDAIKGFAAATKQEVDDAKKRKDFEEKKDSDILDLLDLDNRPEAEKILNNKKRRKAIEERCPIMNFEDLILKGEVRQRVPIMPGKFEPTFRSITPDENLNLKALIAKDPNQTDFYLTEKLAIYQLTCSLVALNDETLSSHLKSDGTFDEALFKIKFNKLMKWSGYIISDLGINYMWFDLRVRRLINPEELGNG